MLTDNYVKEEDGTGVVHQAPYFGAVSIFLFSLCSSCLFTEITCFAKCEVQNGKLSKNDEIRVIYCIE